MGNAAAGDRDHHLIEKGEAFPYAPQTNQDVVGAFERADVVLRAPEHGEVWR